MDNPKKCSQHKVASDSDYTAEYRDIREMAKQSIIDTDGGPGPYTLDLTQYFTVLPEYYARRIMYMVLAYWAEARTAVTFTANERNSGTGGNLKRPDTYWSALFPIVSSVKQFTDIEQEMYVHAMGNRFPDKYYPQKLALSKYVRDYPSGRTKYTFGISRQLDLANTVSQLKNS